MLIFHFCIMILRGKLFGLSQTSLKVYAWSLDFETPCGNHHLDEQGEEGREPGERGYLGRLKR